MRLTISLCILYQFSNLSWSISDMKWQVHSKRMFVAPTKWLLFQDRKMIIDNDNFTFTYNDSVLEIFEDMAIYPDSDVILAQRFDGDFFELSSIYRPSPQRSVMRENRGNWTIENGLKMSTFDVASARRKNLQQTTLKSCLVVLWNIIVIVHLNTNKTSKYSVYKLIKYLYNI